MSSIKAIKDRSFVASKVRPKSLIADMTLGIAGKIPELSNVDRGTVSMKFRSNLARLRRLPGVAVVLIRFSNVSWRLLSISGVVIFSALTDARITPKLLFEMVSKSLVAGLSTSNS